MGSEMCIRDRQRTRAQPAQAQPPWAKHVPPGYQRLSARVPMKVVTCEQVKCQPFVEGWWESADEHMQRVVAAIGYMNGSGDAGWVWNEPGTHCPKLHKTWDDRFAPQFYVAFEGVKDRAIETSEAFDRAADGARTVDMIKQGRV